MCSRFIIKGLNFAYISISREVVQAPRSGKITMATNHIGNGIRSHSSSSDQKTFTVCIEGNIASGKTTLLQYFKDTPHAQVCEEPVKKWRNVDGENALELMYKDPKRWAFTLQTYIQLTMMSIHSKQQSDPVKMMERSIFSAKYCFVENLFKSNVMPRIEYVILTEWFDWLIATQNINVDLIVYLQTRPETCFERIKKRCRPEETQIPLFTSQLQSSALQKKKYSSNFEPVKTINTTKSVYNLALHDSV
ncbi:hypothetical protein ScPMuIL_000124 [Solemya velum]